MRRHRRAIAVGCLALLAIFFAVPPDLLAGVSFSRAVLDRHGVLLHLTMSEDEKYRQFVPLRDISPTLIEATLLHEDRHFREHFGINPLSVLRAGLANLTGGGWIGASTITMQLARLEYGLHTRNPLGKLVQMLCALRIELHHGKDEILEAYLNRAPYGWNIEGVGAASAIYFQHPASALNPLEAMSLAVLPQSPSTRAPHLRQKNIASLHAARGRLFARWQAAHPLPREQAALFSLPLRYHTPRQLERLAPHTSLALLAREPKAARIVSTLDLGLQQRVNRIVQGYVTAHRVEGIDNAAVLLLDAASGEVLARIGSADFRDSAIQGQVDGTRARRSPGSTLKPFIYALAMQQGLIHPLSLLKDAPSAYAGYVPDNFDARFMGPVSATQALIRSRNLPALALAAQLRKPTFYRFLQAAHIGHLRPEASYGLSLVLGGAEVTMEELGGLYAMLTNHGSWQPLRTTIPPAASLPSSSLPVSPLPASPLPASEPLLSPEAAFLALDMLRQNPRPQSDALETRSATRPLWPIAWKTGTSNALRDAWTVGSFGPYVMVVWVGQFQGRASGQYVGIKHAAPLFFQLTDALQADDSAIAMEDRAAPPLHLRRLPVCSDTGDVNEPLCPDKEMGWFIPGVSPIRSSGIYRRVRIDPRTGWRLCGLAGEADPSAPPAPSGRAPNPGRGEERVFAFWPSDLLEIYAQAGIPKTPPPPFEPGCAPGMSNGRRSAMPVILTPSANSILRMVEGQPNQLTLKASADADARKLFWFLDAQPLGATVPNGVLVWTMKPGRFRLRVVDNFGRAGERNIRIEP